MRVIGLFFLIGIFTSNTFPNKNSGVFSGENGRLLLVERRYDTVQYNYYPVSPITWKYWRGYITDTWDLVKSPGSWRVLEWSIVAAGAGTAALLYTQDERIKNTVQEHRTRPLDRAFQIITVGGDYRFITGGAAAFYLTGLVLKDAREEQAALLTIENYFVSQAVVQTLKFTTHRHRPRSGDPHTVWDGPSVRAENLSFPSSHSAGAFSVATSISDIYDCNPVVSSLLYAIAALVSFSRIYNNDHWASDVFTGAAIGFLTAKVIDKMHIPDRNSRLAFCFTNDTYRFGLEIPY